MKKSFFIGLMFLTIFSFSTWGQEIYRLYIKDINTGEELNINYKKTFVNTFQREKELNNIKMHFLDNGYLGFSVDSISGDSLNMSCIINPGLSYKWLILNTSLIEAGVLKKINFKHKNFDNKTINITSFNRLKEGILSYYENNGYPFAEVGLDSIIIEQNNVKAWLIADKKQLILFDTIVLTGNGEIKKTFLENYIGIKKNNVYSESQVQDIDKKLKELPFLSLKQATSVDFSLENYRLIIALNKKKASHFDGVLGIIPDNITGKLKLTGDVKLKLLNSFKAAEMLELNWKKLNENSQRLIAGFDYPYIFSSNIGLAYALDIMQKDTTYITVKHNAEVKYMFDGYDYISFNGQFFKSSMLNTANFSQLNFLPDYADVFSVLFGMGFHKENFNFRLNPSRGYQIKMLISTGNRTLQKNTRLNDTLYNGIEMKTQQYKYDIGSQLYFNPFGKNVIKLAFVGGKMFSKQLFQNELYRIGGTQLLRGFDEESIRASLFAVFTVEYRFLLENLSYLSVFFDKCYYENLSINNHIIDRPFGLGAGFSFDTKQGVFSISYAIGKQFDNPLEFKSGKIHLGYISYF